MTIKVPAKLTKAQRINALQNAHRFFSEFDRVPGALAQTWAQAIDAIAIVCNDIIINDDGEPRLSSDDPIAVQLKDVEEKKEA